MLVDSHCHLDLLPGYPDNLHETLQAAHDAGVAQLLCVCVRLNDFPRVLKIAQEHASVFASVGLHPDEEVAIEPTLATLLDLGADKKVIAVGETGLDYYRVEDPTCRQTQRTRFETHIQAAIALKKPLIIHTRMAADDTIACMKSAAADSIGGVMHCFTESVEIAQQALDLNFYISLSGIVTFKNAAQVQAVARYVPLDRLLIETDSPYLAPVPYRGKSNQPAYVRHVAEAIATLKGVSFEAVAAVTTQNFSRLFFRHGEVY